MYEEIESKVLGVDPEQIEVLMKRIGAEQEFDGEVRSLFFDYPSGEIEENGVLRLRRRGDTVFVTLKNDRSRENAKCMEEIEFEVGSFDEVREFLVALGLEQLHDSRKKRTVWTKEDVEYVVDRYPAIPPLLEVEAPSTDALEQALQELGYTMDDAVSWDTNDLMQHYGKELW